MINLTSFISAHKLDSTEVAKELFPTNAYPVMALRRIISGSALLDSDQITRLAAMANTTVEKVFNNGWSVATDFICPTPKYILTSGDWRAEIDRATWVTKLFCKDKAVSEKLISSPTVTLSEFINALELVIAKKDFK